jgi:hypothetical protein
MKRIVLEWVGLLAIISLVLILLRYINTILFLWALFIFGAFIISVLFVVIPDILNNNKNNSRQKEPVRKGPCTNCGGSGRIEVKEQVSWDGDYSEWRGTGEFKTCWQCGGSGRLDDQHRICSSHAREQDAISALKRKYPGV